jgi:phosphatidylserine/phosphatidylglycerophosphate/cardiolipin synthase-like enzyme
MTVIIEPDAGIAPVVRAIRKARRQIDICIFRLDRQEIEKALAGAVQRGVKVRALIASTNRGGESRLRKLEQRLLEAGVTVTRTGDDLLRYHAKYMVADDTLHLFGFNLTKLDIEKSRSFGIATRDRRTVQEATKLFEADSTRQPYSPGRSNLVVSPDTARTALAAFIRGARRQLAVYDGQVQDRQMIKLIRERAARGVDVRIIGKLKGSDDHVQVRPLKPWRLHVRAVVRDGTQAFVGSQSLRKGELDNRREVGLLIRSRAAAREILKIFEADWADSGEKKAADEIVEPERDVEKDRDAGKGKDAA